MKENSTAQKEHGIKELAFGSWMRASIAIDKWRQANSKRGVGKIEVRKVAAQEAKRKQQTSESHQHSSVKEMKRT